MILSIFDLNESEKHLFSRYARLRACIDLFLGLNANRSITMDTLQFIGRIGNGYFKKIWDLAFRTLLKKSVVKKLRSQFEVSEVFATGDIKMNGAY